MSDPVSDPTKVLRKADLLSGKNLHRVLVEVPELGGCIYLQELSAKQLLDYNATVRLRNMSETENPEASIELMALLLTMSACDETGALLFAESDTQELMNNSIQLVTRLGAEVLKISGINPVVSPQEVAADLKNEETSSSI